MKIFFAFTFAVLAATAAATPSGQLVCINQSNDQINQLWFRYNGQQMTLIDHNGLASVAAIVGALSSKASSDKWESIKGTPVEGWEDVRKPLLESMRKFRDLSQIQMYPSTINAPAKAEQMQNLINYFESMKKAAPSYEELNRLGQWLENSLSYYQYELGLDGTQTKKVINIDAKNSSENPIGFLLSARGFTMPKFRSGATLASLGFPEPKQMMLYTYHGVLEPRESDEDQRFMGRSRNGFGRLNTAQPLGHR